MVNFYIVVPRAICLPLLLPGYPSPCLLPMFDSPQAIPKHDNALSGSEEQSIDNERLTGFDRMTSS